MEGERPRGPVGFRGAPDHPSHGGRDSLGKAGEVLGGGAGVCMCVHARMYVHVCVHVHECVHACACA